MTKPPYRRTNAQLVRDYDRVRARRNKVLDELDALHAALMSRARQSRGVVQTDAGYASIGFQSTRVLTKAGKRKLDELVGDGTIKARFRRDPRLTVVAYKRGRRGKT